MRWVGDRGGRPSKLSRGLVEMMARQMAEADLSLTYVLRLWEIHRVTGWRWRRRHRWVAQIFRAAEIRRRELREERQVDRRLNRPLHADPARNGRPSTYRPEFAKRVRSSNVSELARQIRRPRRTVRGWMPKHRELRLALARERLRELDNEISALRR